VEQLEYDRKRWGKGPWEYEPDRFQWQYNRYPCLVVRAPFGNLCGYVAVPRGHVAYGKGYEKLSVNVHGGLTYSAKCQGHICHTPAPGEPDDVWWLGFDCAHSRDLVPKLAHYGLDGVYRDMDYVKREVEILASQLETMKKAKW
jgi:hypothetical protein